MEATSKQFLDNMDTQIFGGTQEMMANVGESLSLEPMMVIPPLHRTSGCPSQNGQPAAPANPPETKEDPDPSHQAAPSELTPGMPGDGVLPQDGVNSDLVSGTPKEPKVSEAVDPKEQSQGEEVEPLEVEPVSPIKPEEAGASNQSNLKKVSNHVFITESVFTIHWMFVKLTFHNPKILASILCHLLFCIWP